jgi:diguanylate cyclase (GGDEF)-like protein
MESADNAPAPLLLQRPRRSRFPVLLWAVGVALLAGLTILIMVGPTVMSRRSWTAMELLAVYLGLAYGLLLALQSRSVHIQRERLYSNHLEDLSQRLRTMAYRDVLTGLYNHRYFHEQLGHEIDRSVRYGQPLTVMLMDMDNFKVINDVYGHLVGDKFLSMVGQIVAKQVRSSDVAARYGGDEFAVILPNTTTEDAQLTADKLAEAVGQAASMHAGGEAVRMGISVGFASCPADARLPSDLLQVADRRLYEQKAAHRVRHAGSERASA